jgi:excisionase family DNA binding protein
MTKNAERVATPLCGRLALRPDEAAEYLGVSERTFREWAQKYVLPKAVEGNSMTLYERHAIEAMWERVKADAAIVKPSSRRFGRPTTP